MSKKLDKADIAILQADLRELDLPAEHALPFIDVLCDAITKATAGGKKVTLGPIQARMAAAALSKILDDHRREAKAA